MHARTIVLGVMLLAAVVVSGCPKNSCFFEVCNNGQCTCHISSCVDGATFDTGQRTCVCEAGRLSVAGQCLTQAGADAYCGRGFRFGPQGCAAIVCANGQQLDEGSGQCVAANLAAGSMGVQVGEGETIACPAGTKLVIEGGSGACVPEEHTCAPDEQWNGAACAKVQSCPTGSQWDAGQNACVTYTAQGDDAAIVDVTTWAGTSYGPNGGMGSSGFCSKLARKPWRFGVPQGQSATVQVSLQLAFPESQVKGATVSTTPSYGNNPTPVPPQGREAVQTAANDVLSTLKQGGGRASQPALSTTVRCIIKNGAPPLVIPATGGV